MALNINDMSDELRDELVAVFMWPTFDDTELRKFTTAISKVIINHFKDNAELTGSLTDETVTGTVDTTGGGTQPLDNGDITDDSLDGGII